MWAVEGLNLPTPSLSKVPNGFAEMQRITLLLLSLGLSGLSCKGVRGQPVRGQPLSCEEKRYAYSQNGTYRPGQDSGASRT